MPRIPLLVLCLAVSIGELSTVPCAAQRSDSVAVGARIRVRLRPDVASRSSEAARSAIVGTFASRHADTLALDVAGSRMLVPTAVVDEVAVSRGPRPLGQRLRRGLRDGFRLSLVVAPLAALAAGDDDDRRVRAVGLSVGLSLLAGMIAGVGIKDEQWQTLERSP
jgi:hypothetical protein